MRSYWLWIPSIGLSPVAHDSCGWSPYQQHTSAARVIESPRDAMLLGSGVCAPAGEATSSEKTTTSGQHQGGTHELHHLDPSLQLPMRRTARA